MKVMLNGKIWDKDEIVALIERNDAAVARALMIVYENQTVDEKSRQTTCHHNGVGFTARDAAFLSDIAKKWKIWGRWASKRQCDAVRAVIKKYHRQILQHMLDNQPGAVLVTGRAVREAMF